MDVVETPGAFGNTYGASVVLGPMLSGGNRDCDDGTGNHGTRREQLNSPQGVPPDSPEVT
jgi:hypothetical protein